ncbi:MAG: replication initiator protein A [Gammaproteobacteria bacterium]|nr:replication initiator protein A [Gammaproteobacteria bacterium]
MPEPLLPIRHPNKDFFVCDIFDTLPGFRDDRASMEHPIFSLSTKPDMRTLEYKHNGNTVKIIPSGLGLATIHDKDILLYVVSYLRAAMKEGQEVKQRVRLTALDLMVSTNRATGGIEYKRLENALNRLRGTTINTNIKTNDQIITEGFGLIDSWEAVRRNGWDGRLIALEIKLSDWFFNALLADELLSINRNYFRLRKPIERRLYEIGRKHCGEQSEFAIGLDKLKKKVGSKSHKDRFKQLIKKITDTDRKDKHFPDYGLYLNDNVLVFKNRRSRKAKNTDTIPLFEPWVLEKAKTAAPGHDIYALEREWREWAKDKPKPGKGYPAAFIGFCKQKPSIQ